MGYGTYWSGSIEITGSEQNIKEARTLLKKFMDIKSTNDTEPSNWYITHVKTTNGKIYVLTHTDETKNYDIKYEISWLAQIIRDVFRPRGLVLSVDEFAYEGDDRDDCGILAIDNNNNIIVKKGEIKFNIEQTINTSTTTTTASSSA